MAFLTSCQICGISLCNSDVCGDCQKYISNDFMKGGKLTKDEIKEKVYADREERRKAEMKQKLHDLAYCPFCGKKR